MTGKGSAQLTFTLDPDLLEAAQRYARERETTVEQILRDFLAALAERGTAEEGARNLRAVIDALAMPRGGRRWTRDELYE